MKRLIVAGIFSIGLLTSCMLNGATFYSDTTSLKAKPIYGKEAKTIAFILDNNHYRKIQLNDSLSSVILDQFVKSLDNNKSYFTKADLATFDVYRNKIDDLT